MILLYPLGLLWALPFGILGALVSLLTFSWPYTTRGPAVICRMSKFLLWFFPKSFNVAGFTWSFFIFVRRPLHDKTPGSSLMMVDRALVRHELEHVYQAMRWGPLFPFLYLLSMLVAWLQGKRPYADSVFEIAARKAEAEL